MSVSNVFLLIQYLHCTSILQADRSSVSTNLLRTVEDTSLLLSFKVPLDGDASSSRYEKPLTPPSSDYLVVAGAVSKLYGDLNGSYDFPATELSYDSSLLKLPPGWKNLVAGDNIQYVGMFLSPEQANVMLPGQFKRYQNSESYPSVNKLT